MKLRITTPLEVLVDESQVASLRAEDASGGFGIQPGHADFLTSLVVSVVRWTSADGMPRYCAVRRGVFSVIGGQAISIATREAVVGTDLAMLSEEVLARFRHNLDIQRTEHVASARLQLDAMRQIVLYLRPRGAGGGTGRFT